MLLLPLVAAIINAATAGPLGAFSVSFNSSVSDWYLSIKTSKGYCGLLQGDGVAAAIQCNNKGPQYLHQFTLFVQTGVWSWERSHSSSSKQQHAGDALAGVLGAGWRPYGARDAKPLMTGDQVLLLSRNIGICSSSASNRGIQEGGPAHDTALGAHFGSGIEPHGRHGINPQSNPAPTTLWGRLLRAFTKFQHCASRALAALKYGSTQQGARTKPVVYQQAAGPAFHELPPEVVQCRLAQPSTITYTVFKSGMKVGEAIDLDKDGLYLFDGSKYCSLADVNGTQKLMACNLDSAYWAYTFTFQRFAQPRASFSSLATHAGCGITDTTAQTPHDVSCLSAAASTAKPAVQMQRDEGEEDEEVHGGQHAQHAAFASRDPLHAGSAIHWQLHSASSSDGSFHNDVPSAVDLAMQGAGIRHMRPAAGSVAGASVLSPYHLHGALGRVTGSISSSILGQSSSMDALSSASQHVLKSTDGSRWQDSDVGAGMSGGVGVGVTKEAGVGVGGARTYAFSLLLQTPGTVMASGAVVGILTWQEGLVGLPLQQCCAQAPSPHVVMCDTLNGTVMPNECWFIVYKVQQAKSKAKVQEDLRRADVTVRDIDHGSKRRSLLGRWQQPMRKRRTRRRTLSLHGNGVDAGRVPDSMSVSGGVRQRKAGDDHARALVASDATAHALDVGQAESTEHEQLRPDGRVHVVEPITNGDLVMLYNKAFGRYCSVSFDGELLCVSVKPSNATRNLFVLGMQP